MYKNKTLLRILNNLFLNKRMVVFMFVTYKILSLSLNICCTSRLELYLLK